MTSTELAKNGNQEIALPGDMPWDLDDSLDELKQSEIPTPRLRVVGKECVFENTDTSEKYDSLEVIILGLVRARNFWPDEIEEGGQPYCRSLDAVVGMPNVDDDISVKKQFPWARSGFVRKDLPVLGNTTQPLAPCDSCVFSKWDDENNKPAPCNELLNLPVYYRDKFDNWSPAILTFQRSGFKATTRYLGTIKSAKQASFMYYTTIGLEPQKKGDTDYATPKFTRGDMTDGGEPTEINGKMVPSIWAEYHQTFTEIKDFLRRARSRSSDDVAASAPVNHNAKAEAAAAAAAETVIDAEAVEDYVDENMTKATKSAKVQEPAATLADDDEDLF